MTIWLGLDATAKDAEVRHYCGPLAAENGYAIRKVVLLGPAKFRFACAPPSVEVEHVDWPEIQMYRTFYRLMREIDAGTLLVINECLRTQNRYDLTYNCLRNFLNQTPHRVIFQHLPLIHTVEDFMILFDFDTRSIFKREPFRTDLVRAESLVRGPGVDLVLRPVEVPIDAKLRAAYARAKQKLFAELGAGDPHTLPRQLHLVGGKAKLGHVDPARSYLGRNNRFKLPNVQTYKEELYDRAPYTVFEWPHNFIDFADVVALAQQRAFDVLTTDIKADRWYLERYQAWVQRVHDAQTALLR